MDIIERVKVYEKFKASHVSKCCGKPIKSIFIELKKNGKYERIWTCTGCERKTTPVSKKKKGDPL